MKQRRKKGPKLTATMREAVAIANENGGHLNRYTGGVWNGPAGRHPGVPTNTVRALVKRGVFTWGRHECNAAGSYPVDAILTGSQQRELFPPLVAGWEHNHQAARFLLLSEGWTCNSLVEDGKSGRLERWHSPAGCRCCILDLSGPDAVFYFAPRTHTPAEILTLNPVF